MTKVLDVSHKFQSRAIKCPICGGKADATVSPFCSKRCRDVDLGHWITGNYYLTSEPRKGQRLNPSPPLPNGALPSKASLPVGTTPRGRPEETATPRQPSMDPSKVTPGRRTDASIPYKGCPSFSATCVANDDRTWRT